MKFLVLIWVAFLCSYTVSSTSESYTLINSKNLAKPGCDDRCGDLIVPYPFGIGGNNSECYLNEGFRIYCNTSSNLPKASFTEGGYTSIKLISDSNIRTTNIVASRCYTTNGTLYNAIKISANYRNRPYTFSKLNKFTVIGCNDYAWLTARTKSRNVSTGCMVLCSTPDEIVGDQCAGNACCQSSIPHDINFYTSRVRTMLDSNDSSVSYIRSFDPCTYAFVGEENVFKFRGKTDLLNGTSFRDRIESTVPLVLEWAIGNQSCSQAKATDGYACHSNSTCISSKRESGGYHCVCREGYEGNPYVSPGCQDINECDDVKKFPCYGTCENTLGNYTCKCKGGYSGDGKTKDGCRRKLFHALRFSIDN